MEVAALFQPDLRIDGGDHGPWRRDLFGSGRLRRVPAPSAFLLGFRRGAAVLLRVNGDFLQAVIRLGPVVVVNVVVVVAGAGDGGFEELVVGLLEHGRAGHEAAAGVAVDADAVDVDPGVPAGEGLDGRLLIDEAVVAEVEVAEAVIGFAALGAAAAVADLDDDEAELRQLLISRPRGEGVAHPFLLRAGVDVDDDRILLGRVEIERPPHVAVEIGHAVAGFDVETLRQFPAGLLEPRRVGLLQRHDDLAFVVPQGGHRGEVGAAEAIDDELLRRRQRRPMVSIAGGQVRQIAAVEADAVEVVVVDVLAGFAGVAEEVHEPILGVDFHDPARPPFPGRDRVLEFAVAVVQVEVAPARSLRPPDHLIGFLDQFRRRQFQVCGFEPLRDQALFLAGRGVHPAVLVMPAQAIPADELDLGRGLAELDIAVRFVLPLGLQLHQ